MLSTAKPHSTFIRSTNKTWFRLISVQAKPDSTCTQYKLNLILLVLCLRHYILVKCNFLVFQGIKRITVFFVIVFGSIPHPLAVG
jgi:hypothetical protein